MPGRYDFEIGQGDTISKIITWYDVNKTPVDVSPYHAIFKIYNPKTLAAILTLLDTGASPGIVLGGVTGNITVTITAIQSGALTFDFANYTLRMYGASGLYHTLLEGVITNIRRQ